MASRLSGAEGEQRFQTNLAPAIIRRDDCKSVLAREDGLSCVCAKVVSLSPLEISDSVGSLQLTGQPSGDVDVNDLCYFLLDPSVRPIRCERMTPIPNEMLPVANYQLSLFRKRNS
ncbi:hypothetical protein AB6A40_003065 [Gnathostoma spinigerum]|uniref:Uncharacterized protein n=1 Tax=Gnathostoma spinigerum TaxID=75299 RepID=A0ABD6E9Q2_9BILA